MRGSDWLKLWRKGKADFDAGVGFVIRGELPCSPDHNEDEFRSLIDGVGKVM